MAFTQLDIDALDRAIASGELTVRHGDRLVTYRSVDELLRARSAIAAEIVSTSVTTRAYPRWQQAVFSDS